MSKSEYKPLTIETIKKVLDDLGSRVDPPLGPVYLLQEEWESLCALVKPMQMDISIAYRGIPVVIETKEQRYMRLYMMKLENDETRSNI